MANLDLGFKFNTSERTPVTVPLDSSTTAIKVGDMLTIATAGYYKVAGSGDIPYGVAMQQVDTAEIPASDGGRTILMDVSRDSVYRYAISGTADVTMRGKTCDIAGPQTIDVAASTDDQVEIVELDLVNNTALVRLLIPSLGGVV